MGRINSVKKLLESSGRMQAVEEDFISRKLYGGGLNRRFYIGLAFTHFDGSFFCLYFVISPFFFSARGKTFITILSLMFYIYDLETFSIELLTRKEKERNAGNMRAERRRTFRRFKRARS